MTITTVAQALEGSSGCPRWPFFSPQSRAPFPCHTEPPRCKSALGGRDLGLAPSPFYLPTLLCSSVAKPHCDTSPLPLPTHHPYPVHVKSASAQRNAFYPSRPDLGRAIHPLLAEYRRMIDTAFRDFGKLSNFMPAPRRQSNAKPDLSGCPLLF